MLADPGYRGAMPEKPETRLILSHTRRLPPRLKRLLKRREVLESVIGHMKTDGCGAGHNLRLILARLRALYCALIAPMATLIYGPTLQGDRQ